MVVVLDAGSEQDQKSIGLDTREGNHIRNKCRPEKPVAGLRDGVDAVRESYGGVREVLSATARYNCAGLVFGARRTHVFMDEIEEKILDDDGFEQSQNREEWGPGDVVLYRDEDDDLTHVARIHSIELGRYDDPVVLVVSQWGETGEFLHEWREVPPQLGCPQEVWSQRRTFQ